MDVVEHHPLLSGPATTLERFHQVQSSCVDFEVVGEITEAEVIAIGNRIRSLRELQKRYGKGRWRKLKGIALVRIRETGQVRKAELHWYEAHGIGRRRLKIKTFLD